MERKPGDAFVAIFEDRWGMRTLSPTQGEWPPIESVVDVLARSLPRVPWFGIVDYFKEGGRNFSGDTLTFGFGNRCWLQVDESDGRVESICFDIDLEAPEAEIAALRLVLENLADLTPLNLEDDYLELVGPLRSAAFLDRYFARMADWLSGARGLQADL